MRTIELAGAVGSGKTTLAAELVTLLAAAGIDAVPQADAVARTARGRIGLRVDLRWGIGFGIAHPRLALLVSRQLARAAIDASHRRRIAGLVLRLGARLRYLQARLPDEQVVVVDEGFVQRAVNVFGWLPGALSLSDLERYLRLAPIGDVVVVVEGDPATADARARGRGLPRRVAAKPAAEAARFLARAAEVVDHAASLLEDRGATVIRVRNDGTLDAARSELQRVIPTLGISGEPPVARIGPLVLPRPRRGRRGSVAPDGLAAAMVALGLDDWRLIRPLGRATGRSGSALVKASGSSLVVKRYKSTVPLDQVRIEHEILRELEVRAFPAPRLRAGAAGATIIEAGGGIFAAFTAFDGYRRSDDLLLPPWDAASVPGVHGQALGALHARLAGFVPHASSPHGVDVAAPSRRVRDLAWHQRLLDATEAAAPDPAILEEVDELRRSLSAHDAVLAAMELPAATIHGDFGAYNVLVRNGQPLFVIDYELARFDWRVVDLATALPRYGEGSGGTRRMARFLDGYRSRQALRPEELRAIPDVLAFLSLRRAAVLLARWADAGDATLRVDAGKKLMLARTIRSGNHPVTRVVADARPAS